MLEQLRTFGGPLEYGLGDASSEAGDVSHEVYDFYYVKYLDHAAHIAVAVTRPNPKDSCHAAAPSLSFVEFVETPRGWELGTVQANAMHAGAWGDPPHPMRAMEIGYNMFAITIEGGFTNQGYTMGYTSIYTTLAGAFKEVFKIETCGNDGGTGRPSKDNWSTVIERVRKGTSFYDLVVHRKGQRDGRVLDDRETCCFDGRTYVPAGLYR